MSTSPGLVYLVPPTTVAPAETVVEIAIRGENSSIRWVAVAVEALVTFPLGGAIFAVTVLMTGLRVVKYPAGTTQFTLKEQVAPPATVWQPWAIACGVMSPITLSMMRLASVEVELKRSGTTPVLRTVKVYLAVSPSFDSGGPCFWTVTPQALPDAIAKSFCWAVVSVELLDSARRVLKHPSPDVRAA